MLGSITPLGERGRGSRWLLTVTAYVIGSTLAGAAIGSLLGLAGSSFASRTAVTVRRAVLAVGVVGGLLVDLGAFGLRLPTVPRQVDEGWRGGYRGWVWGFGFGIQLGTGVVTVVTTSTVYATWLAAGLSGGVVAGAVIGATFGVVRAAPVLADRGLYAGQGVPGVRAHELDPRAIQAAGPGRLGVQRFFSLHGRAFSLYAMAREGPRLEHSLRALNASLRSLTVGVG